MDGRFVVRLVEQRLAELGISKKEFYENSGISSATFSQWRTGQYEPSPAALRRITEYLGIHFVEGRDPTIPRVRTEMDDLMDELRSREDLRILLRSAKDVPPSSVYSLIAQIEKTKEDAQ